LWFTPSGQAVQAKCLGEAAEEAEVVSNQDDEDGLGMGIGVGMAEDLFQDGDIEEKANQLRLRAREERKRALLLAQSQAEAGPLSASGSGSGLGSGSGSASASAPVPAPMSAKDFKRARYLAKQASKANFAGAGDTVEPGTSDSATRLIGDLPLDGILQPVPVPGRLSRDSAAGSRASSSSPGPESGRAPGPGSRTSTPSSLLDLPAYPTLPEGMLSDRELPKPLHSDKPARKKETGPATLVPDLPWVADSGADSDSAYQQPREEGGVNVTVLADEVIKVLGEIERKEEEEDSATCKWQR
jgi:hypothetical protein